MSPAVAEVPIMTSLPVPVLIVLPTSTAIEITSFLFPEVILYLPEFKAL